MWTCWFYSKNIIIVFRLALKIHLSSQQMLRFAEAYLCFLVPALAKMPRQLNSYGLKKIFLFKKEMFCFIKNNFCFSHKFQTWFHDADHLLHCLFILLLLSYISFWEIGHRNNTNPSLFIQVAKVQQNEWKTKHQVSECEYVHGQRNNLLLQLLLKHLPLEFSRISKILIKCSLIKFRSKMSI